MSEKVQVFEVEAVADDVCHRHHRVDGIPPQPDFELGVWESIRENPKAIGWCSYMLFLCLFWGYDGLSGGIVASIPAFRHDYGYKYDNQYVIPAKWLLAFTIATSIGVAVGAAASGMAMKHVGQRVCLFVGLVVAIIGTFCQYYSPGKIRMFLAGKLLTGLPLGVIFTIAPVYCSEVAPLALRGAAVGAVSTSVNIGQMLVYGVLRAVSTRPGSQSYQMLFAVIWAFAAVGLIILPFVPESPLGLLSRGKEDEARKNIPKIYSPQVNVDEKLAYLKAVLEHDSGDTMGKEGYTACFRKENRMRTLVALSAYFIYSSTGNFWILGYMGYFMELGGISGSEVFDITLGASAMYVLGSMIAWFLVERFGRRLTNLGGMMVCTISLLVVGILTQFLDKGSSIVLAQVSFMAIWAFAYQASIGTLAPTIVAEVSTSSLRAVTQSMCIVLNGVVGGAWQAVLPYMVNPDEGNMGGNIAWIFLALLVASDIFIYLYWPETKGRTFAEIDELYRRGVKPRHFSRAVII